MKHYVCPLLVLLLAFALRLYRLDFQSIWWDEGHSIFVAAHPIAQIPTLPAMDVHPPAYFALLHAWMNVAGRSEFALRFLSVVFSTLTVALLWRFGQSINRHLPLRASAWGVPLLAALLAALSPLYVAYAQEVRSYAMITALALTSTFFFWGLLTDDHHHQNLASRWPMLIAYSLSTAACLYTHYFTIFLLLFQNLVWLVWLVWTDRFHKRLISRFLWWAASQLGILLLFAPQLWLAARQVTSYTNPNLIPPTLSSFINRSWQAYTVGLTIDPTPARWGMVAIAVVLVLGGLIQIFAGRTQPVRLFLFLLIWLLVPLVAYYIVLQRQPSFEPRYMILITPALFLLLALSLNPLIGQSSQAKPHGSHFMPLTLSTLTIIPIIFFIIGLHSYFTNESYFKDNSAEVAGWLADETTPDDVVYIDVPHPFHYYADERGIPAPTRYLFVDIHTAANTLSREAAGRDRLFWVTWWGSDTDPRGVIPFLAEKAGQHAGRMEFKGYRVDWFELPDQTSFSLPAELKPAQARFGDVLRLDGYAFGGIGDTTTTTAAESAWATLHFTLLRDTDVDYRVSLRLRGEDGRIVSQIDKDLLNDRHIRTSAWPLDDKALNQTINVYTLPITPDAPPGEYRLEVVVYSAQPPYPSEGVTGPESIDGTAALLGTITIIP